MKYNIIEIALGFGALNIWKRISQNQRLIMFSLLVCIGINNNQRFEIYENSVSENSY